MLRFAANETTKRIKVWVNGDTTFELSETFTVHLSNAIGATISNADGTGTIVNDDTAPSFAIDDVTHNEGNAGTTSYVFTVTKTGSTMLSSSVDFQRSEERRVGKESKYQAKRWTQKCD